MQNPKINIETRGICRVCAKSIVVSEFSFILPFTSKMKFLCAFALVALARQAGTQGSGPAPHARLRDAEASLLHQLARGTSRKVDTKRPPFPSPPLPTARGGRSRAAHEPSHGAAPCARR